MFISDRLMKYFWMFTHLQSVARQTSLGNNHRVFPSIHLSAKTSSINKALPNANLNEWEEAQWIRSAHRDLNKEDGKWKHKVDMAQKQSKCTSLSAPCDPWHSSLWSFQCQTQYTFLTRESPLAIERQTKKERFNLRCNFAQTSTQWTTMGRQWPSPFADSNRKVNTISNTSHSWPSLGIHKKNGKPPPPVILFHQSLSSSSKG